MLRRLAVSLHTAASATTLLACGLDMSAAAATARITLRYVTGACLDLPGRVHCTARQTRDTSVCTVCVHTLISAADNLTPSSRRVVC